MNELDLENKRNKKRRLLILLAKDIVDEVRARRQVEIGKLAVKYGYSRHYFLYEVVPIILDLAADIKKAKINGSWYLITDFQVDNEAEAKKILEARPVE